MAVWRLQVNTGGANVADYCLQNHVAALGGWQGTCYGAFIKAILHVSDELIEKSISTSSTDCQNSCRTP